MAVRVDTMPRLAGDADTLETVQRPGDDRGPERDRPELPDDGSLRPGERIGRYHILEIIGRGGMGTVYSAFDPQLERRVAIKLLHRGGHGAPDEERARLLTEAKAMAQLSHPNVVTVHEAAVDRGQVFLAMEYVSGRTARSWLAQSDRSWREVVAVFRQAALGLAAAHAAGMIHRDMKPDNILVGNDDRVRITDFGIAVGFAKASSGRSGDDHSATDIDASAKLTQTTGTPAYMSPEHLRGDPLDGRSDQFGFGVALFEALYHRRPFEGRRPSELRSAHTSATIVVPNDNDVPAWLRKVVLQSLEVDPTKRWPSMPALIKQLDHGTRKIPAQRWLVGLIPAGVIAGAVLGGRIGSDPVVCEEATAMAETWGDAQRTEVTRALGSTGPAFADETARTVVRLLDAYTTDWTSSYERACQQHRAGVESDSLFDRRQTCLRARLRAVSSLVEILREPDAEITRNAITAVDALPPVRECEPERLVDDAMWIIPSDPEQRARHEAVLDALTQVQAMFRAGRFRDGLAQAEDTVADARALGDDAVLIRALMVRGSYQQKLDQITPAVASIDEAWHIALRSANTIDAVRAAIRQIELVGYIQRNEAVANARIADAQSLITRVRGHNPELATELQAALLRVQGVVELRFVRATSVARLTEALEMIRSLPERHDLEIAEYLRALANAEFPTGLHDEALAHYSEALELDIGVLGPDHPDVAGLHNNLGLLLRNMGRAEEGVTHLERALAISLAAYGPEHSSVLMVEGNLASVYHQLNEPARALPLWEHALGLPLDFSGADPNVTRMLQFGRDLIAVGRVDEALDLFDSVLGQSDTITTPNLRVSAYRARADALRALGRTSEAVEADAEADRRLAALEAAQ